MGDAKQLVPAILMSQSVTSSPKYCLVLKFRNRQSEFQNWKVGVTAKEKRAAYAVE